MNKKIRATYLVIFLLGLIGLNYYLSQSFNFPSGNESIWFHTGLLMLVLGSYWIEYHFSKPADVAVNGIVVFISISSLNAPPYKALWDILQYYGLTLAVLAIILMYKGRSITSYQPTTKFRRVVYLFTTRFGSAVVMFSAVFFLALISFFELNAPEIKWLLLFWTIVVTAKHLEVDTIVNEIYNLKSKFYSPIGIISRFVQPNIVRFRLIDEATCSKGSLVSFSTKNKPEYDDPLGVVIGSRRSTDSIELESIIIESNFSNESVDKRNFVFELDLDDEEKNKRFNNSFYLNNLDNIVGFATKDTTISHLNFELNKKKDLAEGHLVAAQNYKDSTILFQLTDGLIQTENSIDNNQRRFSFGEAEQIGYWDNEKQGFTTYDWLVPENTPIIHIDKSIKVDKREIESIVSVGDIPNSNYPVNINIKNLVLYHSAILGVTGSGKSYLSFFLIERCIEESIKVICLDITGDYKRHLNDAVLLNNVGATKQFLGDDDLNIGIVEFDNWDADPTESTLNIVKTALAWCKQNRTEEEIKDPKPKVLIVMEEAHAIIPEWNFTTKSKQSTVNEISKHVLQARKYGLGFSIITQRTANVTKSILNQCNTMFAFQAFDETGFDFLKNYMGYKYVNALPNLVTQQCILVGKASVSDRPLIVNLTEQERELNDTLPEPLSELE